jgi:CheY-like chemotaxis protein
VLTVNIQKPRILHLEDDPGWTRKVRQYLGEKYEVVATPSLPGAKGLLDTEDFHLAIVDLSLVPLEGSDTGGFQFMSYLRSSDLWIDLPVVVLTAYDSMDRMRDAFKEFKVFDFLAKDKIEREEFQAFIAQAIAAGPWGRPLGESPRALIVEDNPQWQSKIKHILEEEGCQVDIAGDYSEAIDKLTSQVYHLATVDIRLSDLDAADVQGRDLVDIVRRLRQSVDVIFISAYGSSAETRRAAFDLGARDFIDKGDFQPQHLRLRVRRILRRIIYVTADVDTGADVPTLSLGKEYPLTIWISPTRPQKGLSRSLTRPVTSGRFELEVAVQPYDVDVLPGSTQSLTVLPNDTTGPAKFGIVPRVAGRIELVIDILFRGNTLTRMAMSREVVE